MATKFKKFLLLIALTVTLLVVLGLSARGALNCESCHVEGVSVIEANETIVIGEDTCFRCHEYAPQYEELKGMIHPIHTEGIKGLNIDYLARHPKTSLSCETCHGKINCQSCHAVNIPHVAGASGSNCTLCHRSMENLFSHKKIELRIHDMFGETSCSMCHDASGKRLRMISGDIVSSERSYELCRQCHSSIYKLWVSGGHWANATNVSDNPIENRCTVCHNVHDPAKLYWKPPNSGKQASLDSLTPVLAVIVALYYTKKRRKI